MSLFSFFKIRMLVIDPVSPVAGQLIQAALGQIVIKAELTQLRTGRAAKIVDAALVK